MPAVSGPMADVSCAMNRSSLAGGFSANLPSLLESMSSSGVMRRAGAMRVAGELVVLRELKGSGGVCPGSTSRSRGGGGPLQEDPCS